MITPNDIETKVFSSSLRGYNKKEVDEFLDQVMIDYQALLDQNAKMLERVHVLQKQVAEAKDPARMTQDAKRMMNDISASAEQKAEIIIKNAKHDAENIVRNAKDSTSQADEDDERLRRKVEKFKLRFKQMLEEEIDRVDDNSEDLLDDLREDFYPGMLYGEKGGDMTRVAGAETVEEDPIAELPDVEPTGDIASEGDLSEDDQNPDDDENGSGVSDVTEELEEAAEETGDEAAGEPEEEAGEEELSEEVETGVNGELPEEAAEPEDLAGGSSEEGEAEAAPEDHDVFVGNGAPEETIVIDRAALARAQEEAGKPEEPAEVFQEYDDPDRAEPEEEQEPETEEEQVARYAADYAGGIEGMDDK